MSSAPKATGVPSPALAFDTLFAYRVAALEFVPNEDRVSPPMTASFSLTMLATTAAGDAYTLSELETMYRAAGFADIVGHPVPTGPHTVVVGHAV